VSCSVTQREVGVDTESVAVGLRAALRQDPDVVVLGDLADAETLDTAIKGAETGRLVIATVPSPDVVTTVERMLATFPPEEREIGRVRFADAVRAISAQQLLPTADGEGRVAIVELLIATPAVRECLKAKARLDELPKLLAQGRGEGMQTFQQHLAALVEAGQVAPDTALAAGSPAAVQAQSSKRGGKQTSSA
jgi:twitching motility protein PilT